MKCKLSEIASVKGGKRLPKGVNLISTPNAHPYIRVRDLNGQRTLELNDEYEFVDEETQKKIARYIVKKGDIVLSIVGTIGLVSIVGESLDNANLTENCVKIIVSEAMDSKFLYYYLKSSVGQTEIMQRTVGAVQAKLPIKNIQDINVWFPPKETQTQIASVLSCIDDKIEHNNKINANLQQQAQAIFKSWFVDFEPFQDGEFVESELGPIPKGWRVGSVADIVNLHDSKRIPLSGAQRQRMEKKIYPYYGAASLMDYVENYIFDGIYLLLGEDGTVMDDKGYPILQYVWGKFWVNNHAHVLTGKCGYSVESLYLLFLNTPVKSIVTGAVQAKISQSNLKAIQIIVPPQEVLDRFNELIQPYFSMIRQKGEENKRLENLRDTLLPKLMNGEIDIIKD